MPRKGGINRRPWFYTKPCGRDLSSHLIRVCGGGEGLFMVRASSIPGGVAISCVQEGEILHHLLEFETTVNHGRRCLLNDKIVSNNFESVEEAIHFLAHPRDTATFEWTHPLRKYIDAESAEAAVLKHGPEPPADALKVVPLAAPVAAAVRPAIPGGRTRVLPAVPAAAGSILDPLILDDSALYEMSKQDLIYHIHKLQTALAAAESGGAAAAESPAAPSDHRSPTGPVHDDDESGFASARQEEQYSKIEWEIPWGSIEIGSKIGQGSYGVVYQGKWYGDVAVKKLLVDSPSPDQLEQFQNEVLVLRKTRHRNVLLFMGACTVLPNLAIVTQWAEGGSLSDKIHDAEVSLPKAHKVDIACQIAQGMEYLHSKSITHRDLKSGNILIDNEIDYETGSSPPQIRVADFGLAMMKKTFSTDGSTLGSVYWMAPEIITQKLEQPYTEYSDAYAFGIVLYEMWAEALPYRGMDTMSILYMVGRGLISADLSRLKANTPSGMRDLLVECINRDRDARPQFAEVATRSSKLLKKLPSLARAGSVSAIHSGRGKKSPIKWTPRPLSVRHSRIRSDCTAEIASPKFEMVDEGVQSAGAPRRRSRPRAYSTKEGGQYDNVETLETVNGPR